MDKTTQPITIYFPVDMYENIRKIAERDSRSITQQVVYMLDRGLSIDEVNKIEGLIKRRKENG